MKNFPLYIFAVGKYTWKLELKCQKQFTFENGDIGGWWPTNGPGVVTGFKFKLLQFLEINGKKKKNYVD